MKAGTGTLDMIKLCKAAGLPTPQFRQSGGQFIQTLRRTKTVVATPGTAPVKAPVTAPVRRLLDLLSVRGDMSNAEILKAFALKSRRRMRETYITPALRESLVEYTIPGKPTSRSQGYRLTEKGRHVLAKRAGMNESL